MNHIVIKRIYEATEADDGFRVLVDRVWPRGMTKEKAHIDLRAKDVAPTSQLRKWFGHEAAKWAMFQSKYSEELMHNLNAVKALLHEAKGRDITLLYGAKDEQHNQAIVLKDFITSHWKSLEENP